jgi:hypothetical protein
MKRKVFVIFTTMALLGNCLTPATACGPVIPVDIFSFRTNPDLSFTSYAAGNLGIILPAFAKSYLVIAYRYLVDKPLAKDEQIAAYKLWRIRIRYPGDYNTSTPMDPWVSARANVPNVGGVTIDPLRRIPALLH